MVILLGALTAAKSFASALQQAGIPYTIVDGKGFYERREIIDLDIQHQRKAIVNEHDLQHQRRASHDVDVHSGQTAEKPHLRNADHGEKYTDWQ